MENKIKKILANVLGIDERIIDDKTSPETIENWDSIKHLDIVLALEEEFNVEFEPDEIVELINIKLICLIIKEKTGTS